MSPQGHDDIKREQHVRIFSLFFVINILFVTIFSFDISILFGTFVLLIARRRDLKREKGELTKALLKEIYAHKSFPLSAVFLHPPFILSFTLSSFSSFNKAKKMK